MKAAPAITLLVLLALPAPACGPRDPGDRVRAALAEGRRQDAYALARAHADTEAGARDAETWRLVARAALLTLRTSAGLAAADRALELEPESAEGHWLHALLDQRRRRNVAAVESAREACRIAPEEGRYAVALGELLLGGGMVGTADYPGAETAFREAVRLDPGNARARYGLGKTLVLAGRHEEGARELDASLVAAPFRGDAHYHRGLARLRARDFEGAAADFRSASVLPPQPAHAFFNLARALQVLGEEAEAEELRVRYQVLRPIQMDIETIETNYHSHPDNLKVVYDLASLLLSARRYDDAKTMLESLCRDEPDLPRAHQLLAEAALADDDAVRSTFAAERLLELSPSPPVERLAAQAARLAGDDAAARKHARAAYDGDPGPESCLLLAGVLLEAGQAAEAARVLEPARRAAPQDPRVAGELGRALLGAGRPADAEPLLGAALSARPRNGDWLTARGAARAAQGQTGWAEDDYRAAVAVAPRNAAAYDSLASLLRKAGKKDEADELAARGRETERREESLRSARRGFHANPADADAALRLADVLRELGRDAEADHIEGRSALLREEP
jgi:predicted Zn-dependent protease